MHGKVSFSEFYIAHSEMPDGVSLLREYLSSRFEEIEDIGGTTKYEYKRAGLVITICKLAYNTSLRVRKGTKLVVLQSIDEISVHLLWEVNSILSRHLNKEEYEELSAFKWLQEYDGGINFLKVAKDFYTVEPILDKSTRIEGLMLYMHFLEYIESVGAKQISLNTWRWVNPKNEDARVDFIFLKGQYYRNYIKIQTSLYNSKTVMLVIRKEILSDIDTALIEFLDSEEYDTLVVERKRNKHIKAGGSYAGA